MLLDIHRARQGLHPFFYLPWKREIGATGRVMEWQRNTIPHLIAQRETLDNDIWQMKNRRNNLAEMEEEEKKSIQNS